MDVDLHELVFGDHFLEAAEGGLDVREGGDVFGDGEREGEGGMPRGFGVRSTAVEEVELVSEVSAAIVWCG